MSWQTVTLFVYNDRPMSYFVKGLVRRIMACVTHHLCLDGLQQTSRDLRFPILFSTMLDQSDSASIVDPGDVLEVCSCEHALGEMSAQNMTQ